MWRSWVDRINTINKAAEEPQLSKEDQLKQEQRQAIFNDSWQKCTDLLSSDEGRSESFVVELLPLFCDTYEQFGSAFTFGIIPDDRAFLVALTKELIAGIRKIPEHQNKSESSQALMDNLRSKLHLYNVIRAIQVVSHGPKPIVISMVQQRIPSVMIKLFRSFIDLSPEYYQIEKKEMATIDEIGNIMTDILKGFVKSQAVLHRLITEDALFTILRIMLAKPLPDENTPSSFTSDPTAPYLIWKSRTVDILVSMDMNSEVCQYIYQRHYVELLCRMWREQDVAIWTWADHRELQLALDVLYHQLKGAAKIQHWKLFEEMIEASAYETLCKVLRTGPFDEPLVQLKTNIVHKLVDFSFIGKISPIPSISDGLPYQHSDFSTPQPKGLTDKIIKNVPAFQCLLASFLLYPLTLADKASTVLHIHLFNALSQAIEAHPCNYFVIERTNAVAQFVEGMERYDLQIQKGIMELLVYVMMDLNFVPLKELAVLSLHLQSSSSGKMIALICRYLKELLKTSSKFYVVVQEAGLIDVMSLMLSDVVDKMQSKQHDSFLKHVLDSFDEIIDCVIAMTSTPLNVNMFRRSYRGNLFDLLQYPETRIGALRLFESLSCNAHDPSIVSPTSGNQSAIDLGNTFSRVMEAIQYISRDDLDFRFEVLKSIQRIFKAHQSTKDIFRRVGGYVNLVSMIVALEGAFKDSERFVEKDIKIQDVQRKIVDLIRIIFSVLAASMHQHEVNKKYFLKVVGYGSLENALTLTGAFDAKGIPDQIFGILFGFAVENEEIYDLFIVSSEEGDSSAITIDLMRKIDTTLRANAVKVVNPEITPTILRLQEKIAPTNVQLSRAILNALFSLAQASRHNQVKMNSSGLMLALLQRTFPEVGTEIETMEKDMLIEIIKKLMNMGVSFDELCYLFKRFDVQNDIKSAPKLMDLVLQGISRSRWPNFIQFDNKLSACSTLEVPQLSNFPPTNPGYTLLFWAHIERHNDDSKLTLFSVWDDDQSLFEIYVDSKTKMLHVYNTLTKQVVVFRSFEFQIGFWYHLSIVHYKSRLSVKSSSMYLYVNGVFIEQMACAYVPYPSVPTVPWKAVIGILDQPGNAPKDLVWNLGPIYLLLDTLEKETIILFFNLGARYKSLFQDSLKRFQTYEASSSLFLTLRSISKTPASRRGSTQSQYLTNMMKGFNFQHVPESKIAMAFFACNALVEGPHTGLTLSGLNNNTASLIVAGTEYSKVVLNSSISKIERAIYTSANMGYLKGNPIIAYPFGLDESIWKIGGCAIALKLIERSDTAESLCKSTAILFEVIRYSWRNSEDMERCHGYEIFAYLLKQKRELITVELIELLLVFIGKNPHSPEESIINNPLAYRFVILNFEVWKKTAIAVQRAQLDQFILFLNTSKMRSFNVRRLPKIHLVKKVLLALRMNVYAKELTPHLVNSLKAIMLSNWTTENIRAVATFLASTVSKGSSTPSVAKMPRMLGRSDSTRSTSSATFIDKETTPRNPEIITDAKLQNNIGNKIVQMRNIVLEMLHDILCDKTNGYDYIHKFAVTITNKWPLLFFTPNLDPFTVVLTARIFSRLCVTQGPSYVQKFRVSSEGFIVLKTLWPSHWNLTQLQETAILMMVGVDIADFPLYNDFNINHLRRCLNENKDLTKAAVPDIAPILVAMWDEARKAIEQPTNKPAGIPTLVQPSSRARSNSLSVKSTREKANKEITSATRNRISRIFDDFIQLFNEMYEHRPLFKDACNKQDVVDHVIQILFSSVCYTHHMTADDELNSKDVVLTNFDLDHMSSPSSAAQSPIDGPIFPERLGRALDDDAKSIDSSTTGSSIIKRGGTSALVTKTSPHVSKRNQGLVTRLRSASWSQSTGPTLHIKMLQNSMMDSMLNFVLNICVQSIIDPQSKNLNNLIAVFGGLPPSSHDQQLQFESYLLTHISQSLKSSFQLDMELVNDQRVLVNTGKFAQLAADAVIQGRFKEGGTEQTYDLLATLLELLHSDNVVNRYNANDTPVITLYRAFNRMILVKISDLESGDQESIKTVAFLDYCIHHQKIILSSKNADMDFLRCFCYHLYRYLLSNDRRVKDSAANIWKLLILQKPEHIDTIFNIRVKGMDFEDLIEGFRQILEMDLETFYRWLDSRKVELNILFNEHISRAWETTIAQEHKYSKETFKNYITRRINRLKRLQKREVYEQEIISEYNNKTLVWSQSIYEIEMSRFTKALQDSDGHENFVQSEWARLSFDLSRERAIWGPRKADDVKWRLDYTEGPNRMRKRLQSIPHTEYTAYRPKQTPAPSTKNNASKHLSLTATDIDIDKVLTQDPVELGKDSDNDDGGSLMNENEQEEDPQISYEEDKNRKVLRLLDPGDIVLDVYNVSQIAGLDACEGLLLLCKSNIYLIDNFFQLSDGEVVEIWDVPKEERDQYLLLVAQAAGMETEPFVSPSGDLHTCRKWATADLRDVFKRRFLFRDVALEMFFNDGQNALITVSLSERDELYSKLVSRVSVHEESGGTIFGREKESYTTSGLSNTFRLSSLFGTSTLQELTQRWERREISNFQYLMYLNAIAGRSYNDLTQYPVFPWILADYRSEELDLTNPNTFRDLTRPMGAQTAERRREFSDRYRQWGETEDPTPAFHYGTHYSSAMIVCSFLIRLEPFTQHYLKLQGGTFDHADRLFDSIGKAWDSASEKNMGDVRELIPEFFYLPEFLTNVNKFNFGVKQGTGEAIDSVVLPPWAHGDPKLFIQRHREALESDFVSANLHHWIDLIFGYKQQGPQAIEALNVFHHVSYEGAVDLDSITDIVEKTATIGIINNFGQTPRQLFKKPHPCRSPLVTDPLDKGYYQFQAHLDKLVQSIMPLRDIKQQVQGIDMYNDKLGVTTCQQLLLPPDGSKYIEWGFSDNSLRLYSADTGKILNVFENMHVGYISTACFPDSRTLVTGGTDNVVCVWKIVNEKTTEFVLLESLKGHTSVVTTIAASKTFSVLVSGSEDKTAIIWDLNRKQYIKSLEGHENGIQQIKINDTTGDIITCSGHVVRVWTINGDLYLTKSACPSSESILSCLFYEHKMAEWCNQDLIITGHRKGIVKFWYKQIEADSNTGQQKWTLSLAHQLRHDRGTENNTDNSDVVCLSVSTSRKTLFTGNRQGQINSFVLPDTTDTYHLQKEDKCKECMICKKVFSVLERKNHCRTCGGIFCSGCMSNTPLTCPDKSAKFCRPCYEHLLPLCKQD